MKNRIKKIHMVGIGGAGMSGIAEILLEQGYIISGSDMADSATVKHLRNLGATVYLGHSKENIGDVQVVVRSTAINEDNPEIREAINLHIPIIPRAEMLAELMRLKTGIAIAGTHGKTTTTSLAASIFDSAGFDPTVIIGGKLNVYGANAHLGGGDYLIAEADESDGSFLCLLPVINIITNIDDDHLDYYGNTEEIDRAFLSFMNKVPFYGINIVCGDNERILSLLPGVKRQVLTYGFNESNQLRAKVIHYGQNSQFEVWKNNALLGTISLPQPGRHNILNALAAIGAALAAGIPFDKCSKGLNEFKGVGRRFEVKGEKNGILVIDDYGHHPVEIAATLETAKSVYPGRRVVVAFQPHRFTRTQAHFNEFCEVLGKADELLLTEIYAASEKPIPGVSAEKLVKGIQDKKSVSASYYPTLEDLFGNLENILKPGDVFLTLGAGSITKIGSAWINGGLNA